MPIKRATVPAGLVVVRRAYRDRATGGAWFVLPQAQRERLRLVLCIFWVLWRTQRAQKYCREATHVGYTLYRLGAQYKGYTHTVVTIVYKAQTKGATRHTAQPVPTETP
jgi:hypothetical protein